MTSQTLIVVKDRCEQRLTGARIAVTVTDSGTLHADAYHYGGGIEKSRGWAPGDWDTYWIQPAAYGDGGIGCTISSAERLFLLPHRAIVATHRSGDALQKDGDVWRWALYGKSKSVGSYRLIDRHGPVILLWLPPLDS